MNSQTLCLLPMTAADRPQLVRILHNTSEFEPEEIPIAEEVIDAYLSNPNEYYFITVAKSQDVLLGYICFGPTPLTKSTWDIYWMAVAKAERGQGIGGKLLKSAESGISLACGKLALVETSSKPNYLKTRRFYVNNGYKRVARILDFYAPNDHLFIYEKRF